MTDILKPLLYGPIPPIVPWSHGGGGCFAVIVVLLLCGAVLYCLFCAIVGFVVYPIANWIGRSGANRRLRRLGVILSAAIIVLLIAVLLLWCMHRRTESPSSVPDSTQVSRIGNFAAHGIVGSGLTFGQGDKKCRLRTF